MFRILHAYYILHYYMRITYYIITCILHITLPWTTYILLHEYYILHYLALHIYCKVLYYTLHTYHIFTPCFTTCSRDTRCTPALSVPQCLMPSCPRQTTHTLALTAFLCARARCLSPSPPLFHPLSLSLYLFLSLFIPPFPRDTSGKQGQ